MNCQRCGAQLDPTALVCPFCQLTTPAGVAAQQIQQQQMAYRAQAEAQSAAFRQRVEAYEAERLGKQSLLWAGAGILFCCFPLGTVAIVQASRSSSTAKSLNAAVPQSARIGLVLGIVSVLMSVVLLSYAYLDTSHSQERANARMAAIDKELGKKPEAATLDRSVACLLAEQFTLKNGYEGNYGYDMSKFDCPGKFTQTADTAQLEDFHFAYNDTTQLKAFVCFKHGAKWFVDRLAEQDCSVNPEVASATAAGSDSAAPSATASATAEPTHRAHRPAASSTATTGDAGARH